MTRPTSLKFDIEETAPTSLPVQSPGGPNGELVRDTLICLLEILMKSSAEAALHCIEVPSESLGFAARTFYHLDLNHLRVYT
uniref:Uncharacterized protein n=1 Tax=Timema monikensis TaxID=170555 RepID=A0A7R9HUW2_9NEOP|nr:unnamed protein product [Timema monikensis]